MTDLFVLGFAAGLALAIPVGPMAIMLIHTTASRGWRHGATGAFAMASVDFLYAFVVFIVGAAMAKFLDTWGTALTVAGAAILAWLGTSMLVKSLKSLRHASASSGSAGASSGSILRTYLTFAGATILNPPTALYFLAIAPTLARTGVTAVSDNAWLTALLFGLGVFFGSVIWQQTLAGGGILLRKAAGERLQAFTGIIGGLLILVLAISIAIKGLGQ